VSVALRLESKHAGLAIWNHYPGWSDDFKVHTGTYKEMDLWPINTEFIKQKSMNHIARKTKIWSKQRFLFYRKHKQAG
jgi:hypothetical protein